MQLFKSCAVVLSIVTYHGMCQSHNKQLLDEVFVITLTSTLIITDISREAEG